MTDKKLKIMVVDDSELIRKSLSLIIKRNIPNFEILEADDGVIAMEQLKSNADVDIMFLDWNMPNMTGDKVVEAVRAQKELNHIRIIMVTTEASKEKLGSVMRSGANGYVVKPFLINQMNKVLKQVIDRI